MRLELTSGFGGVSALCVGIYLLTQAVSGFWPDMPAPAPMKPWPSLIFGLGLTWAAREAFRGFLRDDD